MKKMITILTTIFLFSFSAFTKEIEIISYNVENLFDTNHDIIGGVEKEDWTFLPKNYKGKMDACKKIKQDYRRKECENTDWTDDKLKLKISQIKSVLTYKDMKADIIGLVEVENENVVKMVADAMGMKGVKVTNSPDERGVDVALIYNESDKVKFLSSSEIVLDGDYNKKRPTRNILEVKFLVDGKYSLYVYVNHWPSLGNPDEARVFAANKLKSHIAEISKKEKDASFIAMGDFNTIDKLKDGSKEHPFRDVLNKEKFLLDVDQSYKEKMMTVKSNKILPPGSYYYSRGGEWNLLDRFFISPNLVDSKNLDIDVLSYEIVAPDFATKFDGNMFEEDQKMSEQEKIKKLIPKRYDHEKSKKEEVGFSDHFPIRVKLSF